MACIDSVAKGNFIRAMTIQGSFSLSELQADGIPQTCSQQIVGTAVAITTNWNDASPGAGDGQFVLSVLLDVGAPDPVWDLPDGSTQTGDTLTIAADSGILDGSEKQILLTTENAASILELGQPGGLWSNKKILGILNLSRLTSLSGDINLASSGIGGQFISSLVFGATSGLVTSVQLGSNALSTINLNQLSNWDTGSIISASDQIVTGNGRTSFLTSGTTGDLEIFLTAQQIASQDFQIGDEVLIDGNASYEGIHTVLAVNINTSITVDTPALPVSQTGNVSKITGKLTSFTAPITDGGIEGIDLSDNELTSLNLSSITNLSEQLTLNNNQLSSLILPNNTNSYSNINLDDNNMTPAAINNVLNDIDLSSPSGVVRTLNIAGNNAIPDTSSGGVNGLQALASLISKGYTVNYNQGTSFDTDWNTANPGASGDNQVSLPMIGEGYAIVDWGDTNSDVITSDTDPALTHTYAASGTYTISILGSLQGWRFNNGGDALKLTNIDEWGQIQFGNDGGYFYGCSNLIALNNVSVPTLLGSSNMDNAFRDLNLSTFQNINSWDFSGVTSMVNTFRGMVNLGAESMNLINVSNVTSFEGCFRDCEDFNGDITGWELDSAISVSYMFFGTNLFDVDISGWTTSTVQDMSSMFENARDFNQNISTWNVASVTNFNRMFAGTETFNQPVGSWTLGAATMSGIFDSALAFDQNVGGWNMTAISDVSDMFNNIALSVTNYDSLLIGWESQNLVNGLVFDGGGSQYSVGAATTARNAIIADDEWTITDGGQVAVTTFISQWTTSNPGSSANDQISLPLIAAGTYDFNVQWGDGNDDDITVYNQAEVTHTYGAPGTYTVTITGSIRGWAFAFAGDRQKIIDISDWGPLRFTNSGTQFSGCSNLTISASNAPNLVGITSLHQFLLSCESLTNEDFSGWDVSNIQDFSDMFQDCFSFNGDVTSWVMDSATDVNSMFRSCDAFNQNIGSWNVSNVTNFNNMFDNADIFNQDISGWVTNSAQTMLSMFIDAAAFNQDISGWNTSNVTTTQFMFLRADSFDQDLGIWNVTSLLNAQLMFGSITLSTANYDSILIGWDAQAVQSGVVFSGGNSQYSAGAATTARNNLVNDHSWVITDGGPV